MRARVPLLSLLLIVGGNVTSTPVRADTATITSSAIVSAGLDVACMDYAVVGGCVWMTCTAVTCSFDYSVRVRHRIPEAVVASYPFVGNGPWPAGTAGSGKTRFAQEGGASDEGGSTNREQALTFKNTDVIGSPATTLYHAGSWLDGLPVCRPLTGPGVPYFVSTRDYNWRDPLVETPWTLAHLTRGIRAGASRFAGLFPRIGFVNQGHDYKASLVAAKRAADVVRQRAQPHVYVPLDTGYTPAPGQWPPGSGAEYRWQQLVPSVMSCRALPDINDTASITDPYRHRVNRVTGNAWHLWRAYSCCEQAGAVLIFWL